MSKNLKNKVALVTGSSKGIGKVIALKFIENGADVVINGRTSESGMETVREIEDAGGKAIFEKADITVYNQVKAMVGRILERMSKIDILVVSGSKGKEGAITPPTFFREINIDDYMDHINGQYLSRLYCIKAVLDHMVERKSGKIVLLGTDAGRWPTPGESVIGGAAAALVLTTKVLAMEFARWGIRINTISTTVIQDSPALDYALLDGPVKKVFEKALAKQPFPLKANDLAEAVLFFASAASDKITGQTLSVNGGLCFPG